MAYREMNAVLYVALTVTLYALIVFFAILAPSDIGSILDFVSAYAITNAAFIIPATFYKKALYKFKLADPESPEVKKNLLIANIFIGLGVFNACVSITSALLTITGVTEGGH